MKIKLFLAPVAVCLLAVSCVNKDYDLAQLDTEMTVVPGLTTTVSVNKELSATLEQVIKSAPGYIAVPEDFILDTDGNYKSDVLPDWSSTYRFSQDFNIKEYVNGIDDMVKNVAADFNVSVKSTVDLPVTLTVNGKEEVIPAKGNKDFAIHFDNVLSVSQIEATAYAAYTKGTPITLNKNDRIDISVKTAVVTLTDGITISF